MPGIVQDAADIAINKEVKSPCLNEIYILVGDTNIGVNKKMYSIRDGDKYCG